MTKPIEIKKCNAMTELYCKYDTQSTHQPVFIELDPESGVVRASYNAEIGNAVPMYVWHNSLLRWTLNCVPTAAAANRVMAELLPKFARIACGYELKLVGWDDSNKVGTYNEDARDADNSIAAYLLDAFESEDCLTGGNAGAWLTIDKYDDLQGEWMRVDWSGVKLGMTDDQVTDLAKEIELDALAEGYVLLGTEGYLHDRLQELADKEEDADNE